MSWVCPHCNFAAVMKDEDSKEANFQILSEEKWLGYTILGVTCPNPDCLKATISLRTEKLFLSGTHFIPFADKTYTRQIFPSTKKERAKPYPNYIPDAVLNDYQEACAIAELSPKASATLARRCLQGMIRDFWDVKPDTLFKEIQSIEERVDPLIWQGIESIRKVGNIGAHMERDINLIIDVNAEEANLLIQMIEMLLDDWYVARHNKQQKLLRIQQIAQEKAEAKKA